MGASAHNTKIYENHAPTAGSFTDASFKIGLLGTTSSSYKPGSSEESKDDVGGHFLGYGWPSLKLTYCGGSRPMFQKKACVHIGGGATISHCPMTSPIQKPGQSTN